jgi:type IV secretion system protein VirD4
MPIIDKFRIDKLRKWLANDVESFDRKVSAEVDRATADKKQRAKRHIERLRGDETRIKREISVEAERATASIEQHLHAEREKVGRAAKQHLGSGAGEKPRGEPRQVGAVEVLPPRLSSPFRLPVPPPKDKPKDPYLGFYVETVGGKPRPTRLHYHGPKHLLCFGSPGANKTTGLVVPNMMMLRRSIICIDPKGQICAITRRARAEMGKVIILNPMGVLVDLLGDSMESRGWNPLLQLDPSNPEFQSDARKLAEAVVERTGASKGDFFETSMENLWRACCMWERVQKGHEASLRSVRAMLAQPLDQLKATFKRMARSDNYAMRMAGSRLQARLSDTSSQNTSLQDVIETVMKNTVFLDDDRIAFDMVKGGDIDFAAMHDEITTVYVILPVHQLREQSKWLRMFINLALSEFFKRKMTNEEARLPPVLFMLDEFGNLGRLPEILNAMNIARDYRVQLWMFLQHLEQLERTYPKETSDFFAGSGVIQTFNAHDRKTAVHFAEMLGKREVEMTSSNIGGGLNIKQLSLSQNTATQIHPLIQPEDLWRLGRAATVSMIDPCPWPVLGHVDGYWNLIDPKEVDSNPYHKG